MHIIKNIRESLVGMLLNIQGKTKDGVKARKYMIEIGIQRKLVLVSARKHTFLPPMCYTLSKKKNLVY
jgi:hypothetical protein